MEDSSEGDDDEDEEDYSDNDYEEYEELVSLEISFRQRRARSNWLWLHRKSTKETKLCWTVICLRDSWKEEGRWPT